MILKLLLNILLLPVNLVLLPFRIILKITVASKMGLWIKV